MTSMLKEAFETAQELPDPLQDEVAQRLLEDIRAELQWDKTLASEKSKRLLDQMARQIRADRLAGKTVEGGWDEL